MQLIELIGFPSPKTQAGFGVLRCIFSALGLLGYSDSNFLTMKPFSYLQKRVARFWDYPLRGRLGMQSESKCSNCWGVWTRGVKGQRFFNRKNRLLRRLLGINQVRLGSPMCQLIGHGNRGTERLVPKQFRWLGLRFVSLFFVYLPPIIPKLLRPAHANQYRSFYNQENMRIWLATIQWAPNIGLFCPIKVISFVDPMASKPTICDIDSANVPGSLCHLFKIKNLHHSFLSNPLLTNECR